VLPVHVAFLNNLVGNILQLLLSYSLVVVVSSRFRFCFALSIILRIRFSRCRRRCFLLSVLVRRNLDVGFTTLSHPIRLRFPTYLFVPLIGGHA
jgi:hypothetical protein